jgi:hypothetical protein
MSRERRQLKLVPYFDESIHINMADTAKRIEARNRHRLRHDIDVWIHVRTIPRRLGFDADNLELAMDKKTSRRVEHALKNSLKLWGGTHKGYNPNGSGPISREAAQMDAKKWLKRQCKRIKREQRYIATWALQLHENDTQYLRWANKAIWRLGNEIELIKSALRDLIKPSSPQ